MFIYRLFILVLCCGLINTGVITSSFSQTVSTEKQDYATVIMYHRFGESRYPTTNVSIEQFESHLEFIAKGDYTVVPLIEIIETLQSGGVTKDKTLAITVDDAYLSVYTEAWPRLKKYGFPFTVFVATDPVDNNLRNYMSWDQISRFVKEGGTVGQHTSTHLHLPLNDKETIKSDILKSHKSFVKHLGFIPKLFAYPYGETSKLVIDVLGEFGIDHSFGQHSGVTSSYSNHYYLSLIHI